MTDIQEFTFTQKWKWAVLIARIEENRWSKRNTEWQLGLFVCLVS